MTTMNAMLEGMKIIHKHSTPEETDSHCFQAEHDQIWCGEYNADKMNEQEKERMEALGWFEDEDAWSMTT